MKKDDKIDSKILYCLERIFTAYRVLLWSNVKNLSLSPIQLQFLLYLSKNSENMRNVSEISNEFGLSRATVSDAISSLERKELVYKEKIGKDRRFSTINLTLKGRKIAKELEGWEKPLIKTLKNFQKNEKEKVLAFLLKLIDSFRKEGILKRARICLSCRHFVFNAFPESREPHLCKLTNSKISEREINLNCVHYSAA